MTATALAEALGVSVASVSRWESGETNQAAADLLRALDVLGATAEERAAVMAPAEGT
jgi:transcriptional regulator with XRE-family HTH domain